MKKLLLFFSTIFIFTFLAQSQTSGWESGVMVSGGLWGGGSYTGNYEYNVKWYASGGVYGRKFWKEKFGLELGLQYGSYIHATREGNVYFGSQIDPQTGLIGDPSTVKSRHTQQLFEVPVRFVFKKDWNKFGFGCFVGVAPAVFTDSRTYTEVYGYAPTAYTSRYKSFIHDRFFLSADLGLLFRANISEHFALDMRPFFKTSLLPTPLFTTSTLGLSINTVWKF